MSASIDFRGRRLKTSHRSAIRQRHNSEEDAVFFDKSKSVAENVRQALVDVVVKGVPKGRKLGQLNTLVNILRSEFTRRVKEAKEAESAANISWKVTLGLDPPAFVVCLSIGLLHPESEVRAATLRAFRYLFTLCTTTHINKDIPNNAQTNSIDYLRAFNDVKLDLLIARSLDVHVENEMERVQALRLVRRMASLASRVEVTLAHPKRPLPASVVRALVSIGGNFAPEKDDARLSCLATMCEIAVSHCDLSRECSVCPALMEAVLDTPSPRAGEAMLHAVVHLLNASHCHGYSNQNETDYRLSPSSCINVDLLVAPLTDANYKHVADSLMSSSSSDASAEVRAARVAAAAHATLTLLRTWPGLAHLCRGCVGGSPIQSLIGVLYTPEREMTKGVVDLLYAVFEIPAPPEIIDLLETVSFVADSSKFAMRDSWRLSAGYVAEEGLDILPYLAETRPNLLVNHLALLLATLVENGILDALVELALGDGSDDVMRGRVVALLGHLLHLTYRTQPAERGLNFHGLPTLVAAASPCGEDLVKRSRAKAAINALELFHKIKTARSMPIPHSLQLRLILSQNGYYASSISGDSALLGLTKDALLPFVMKAEHHDDSVSRAVRNTLVLSGRDPIQWNWHLIASLLKWTAHRSGEDALSGSSSSSTSGPFQSGFDATASLNLVVGGRGLGGAGGDICSESHHGSASNAVLDTDFLKRLLYFYKPSSNQFSALESGRREDYTLMASVGVELLEHLSEFGAASGGRFCDDTTAETLCRLLEDFLGDFAGCIAEVAFAETSTLTSTLGLHSIVNSFAKEYFPMVGSLSYSDKGVRCLEKMGVFQAYLDLLSTPHGCHETYVKLIVSSLNFSVEGFPRAIIDKILSSPSESNRLYVLRFLRVLLRARVKYFSVWGLKLLVMLLCDTSPRVSSEALDFLDEACEDKVHLLTLIDLQPAVLHLGEKGRLLLARYASVPRGLKYLKDSSFLWNELEAWGTTLRDRYVDLVEDILNTALTSYDPTALRATGTYGRRSIGGADPRRGGIAQRPSAQKQAYVPVHFYGQLTQHKDGFKLLEEKADLESLFEILEAAAERGVDVEEAKTIKAALWCVGHIGSSAWGVVHLAKENVIPRIVALAEDCDLLSVRGTAFNVLGLIASTRQGANILSRYGWLSVKQTWTSRWRPLPMRGLGLGVVGAVDSAKAGLTLGEAIVQESEMTINARLAHGTASTLLNYQSQQPGSFSGSNSVDFGDDQRPLESSLESVGRPRTGTSATSGTSESEFEEGAKTDAATKRALFLFGSTSNPETPTKGKNSRDFSSDAGSEDRSRSSATTSLAGSDSFDSDAKKKGGGAFYRRWNSLPHKKFREKFSAKARTSHSDASQEKDEDAEADEDRENFSPPALSSAVASPDSASPTPLSTPPTSMERRFASSSPKPRSSSFGDVHPNQTTSASTAEATVEHARLKPLYSADGVVRRSTPASSPGTPLSEGRGRGDSDVSSGRGEAAQDQDDLDKGRNNSDSTSGVSSVESGAFMSRESEADAKATTERQSKDRHKKLGILKSASPGGHRSIDKLSVEREDSAALDRSRRSLPVFYFNRSVSDGGSLLGKNESLHLAANLLAPTERLSRSQRGSKASIESFMCVRGRDASFVGFWEARAEAGLKPVPDELFDSRSDQIRVSPLEVDPLSIDVFRNPYPLRWTSRDEAGFNAMKALQRHRGQSNDIIEDMLARKSDADLEKLHRKLSSGISEALFDIDPVSGVYLGPPDPNSVDETTSPVATPSEPRSHSASFVVASPRHNRSQTLDDLNASTIVAAGIFSTGSDVGAGTAEYIGVAVPFRAQMVLSLPTSSENGFLISLDGDEDEVLLPKSRKMTRPSPIITVVTSPLPQASDVGVEEAFFDAALPKPIKGVASVPAPGVHLAPIAPARNVSSSYVVRRTSVKMEAYGVVASKVQQRIKRRSSADFDALDVLSIGASSDRSSSLPSEEKETGVSAEEDAKESSSSHEDPVSSSPHSESDCLECCHRDRGGIIETPPSRPDGHVWKEVLRVVGQLSSSVGVKGNEQMLIGLKQKFPDAFVDACLYSEVAALLAGATYRLPVRRFVQGLFAETSFTRLFEVSYLILAIPSVTNFPRDASSSETTSPETEVSIASNSETNTIVAEPA